ncbi:MAG: hypothetical protein L0Z53_15315, partial [Acidobacteriales bacterium]|nr:hypothetical protein [Terriglobales bacterium]
MSKDVATELMQVARRLLTKDARPIREWLLEIASASDALGAGMSAPADGIVFLEQAAWIGEPIAPPWNNERELREALQLQPDGTVWRHCPKGANGGTTAFLAVQVADAH